MTTNRLIGTIDLPDYNMSVGVLFVQGAGHRVATISMGETRHMSAAAARRLADDLDQTPGLSPVVEALRGAADLLDAPMPTVGMALLDAPVAGHA